MKKIKSSHGLVLIAFQLVLDIFKSSEKLTPVLQVSSLLATPGSYLTLILGASQHMVMSPVVPQNGGKKIIDELYLASNNMQFSGLEHFYDFGYSRPENLGTSRSHPPWCTALFSPSC
jgi:hypothetical protein